MKPKKKSTGIIVPFSIFPPKALKKFSIMFMGISKSMSLAMPYFQLELDRADMKISSKDYISYCITANVFTFFLLTFVFLMLFDKLGKVVFGPVAAILAVAFIFSIQLQYPKLQSYKRIRRLNADLLPALRVIMIQLNSGVPLFDAMAIISKQEFGEVSKEFLKTIKKINAGVSQIAALEDMALNNPSPYFRRTLWQIVNGLKEGSETTKVMDDVIVNLTKEQIIQIEKYGSQLNPLAMFYMMGAVILPALGITFFLVLASFLGIEEILIKLIFGGFIGFVIFFQMMFSGVIKSKRPSLLSDE